MPTSNYFQIVGQCLPADVRHSEIIRLCKPELWESNPREAMALALANSPRINWEAYLENNPDVKDACIDPVEHFLHHGMYEYRKLYSWHPLRQPPDVGARRPKVSIIIPNYNNGAVLERCLKSVTEQTLQDIEIIVIEDGSTDDSWEVIKHWLSEDSRIKAVIRKNNKGTHMARKAGVSAATGEYAMFLDADDVLKPEACELAWKAIAKGYDMAVFNIEAAEMPGILQSERRLVEQRCNTPANGVYENVDLLNMLILEQRLLHTLFNKIYATSILKQAFARLDNSYLVLAEDTYEFYSIAEYIRNFIKIPDILYTYYYGAGITGTVGKVHDKYQLALEIINSYRAVQRLSPGNNYRRYESAIKWAFFKDVAQHLTELQANSAKKFFDLLCTEFGLLYTSTGLAKIYLDNWEPIQLALAMLAAPHGLTGKTKRIGIFYYRLSAGGIETTIFNICRLLVPQGYKISLFLEEKSEFDQTVDESIDIYYLGSSRQDSASTEKHISDLYAALREYPIDLMLYMYVHEASLLWDILLLRLMNIDVIGSMRIDINFELLARRRRYPHSYVLQTLRCLDKVFCLNISTEMYLRSQRVNAIYIPNTIRRVAGSVALERIDNDILVIARLDDRLKKARECLRVLAAVLRIQPDARMIFVGDFNSAQAKNQFFELATKLNVCSRIKITGWVDHPSPYIDQCKLLFSASWLEGFPNGIAEAQARGLPVVMYDLDVMISYGNESIIKVATGDIETAAKEIARLLQNEDLRIELAKEAVRKASTYSDERFAKNISALLNNYNKTSLYRYYTPRQRIRAISYMASYAGNTWPKY